MEFELKKALLRMLLNVGLISKDEYRKALELLMKPTN